MSRERFCKVCRSWHELDSWPRECMPVGPIAASDFPSPSFTSDAIEIRSMHDGQMYSSKSQLRRAYRSAGVEEIGNEKPQPVQKPASDRKGVREALKQAYQQHSA